MTFAENIIRFNRSLSLKCLPDGIRALNPFIDNPEVNRVMEEFYRKYYSDNKSRKIILGINPGRFGAGATGIPFTDTKRLLEVCKIKIDSIITHEPSSVFVYEVIDKYGGSEKFYADFYIQSLCPLGFVKQNEKGNFVNYNYYDSKELFSAVKPFIISKLKEQMEFGIDRNICFVMGKKNAAYFSEINDENKFFQKIVMLEHPRYIVQYKLRSMEKYVGKYLEALKE